MLNGDQIREIERASIRRFIAEQADLYRDSLVLDYGCGRQPYRDVIENAGGEYVPFDRADFPANVSGSDVGPTLEEIESSASYDVVICTQVIQYWREPLKEIRRIWNIIEPGGHLVLTGPTNWPEVEPDDRARYTLAGAVELVTAAGFDVVRSGTRAVVEISGWPLSVGYGIVAQG